MARHFKALPLVCAALTPLAHADAGLSGDQVRNVIAGNTFKGAWFAKQLTIAFHDDGSLVGTLGLHGSDVGRWELDGDLYCQKWTRYFEAERRCYRWHVEGTGYVLENADSFRTHDIRGTVSPGIPAGF